MTKFRGALPQAPALSGLAILVLAAVHGCARPRPTRVVITVVNAEIQPTKRNGEPWDPIRVRRQSSGATRFLVTTIATLLGAPPPLAAAAGALLVPKRKRTVPAPPAPDPFVRLSLGSRRAATPIQPKTVEPSWNYPMVLTLRKDVRMLTVQVLDADLSASGIVADPIGTVTIKARKLGRPGLVSLGPFGAVKALHLKIERYTRSYRIRRTGVRVDGKTSWTRTRIRVIAGQTISVKSSGRVCFKKKPCAGPDGFPPKRSQKWLRWNRLSDKPHEGLLLRIHPERPVFVGSAGRVVATRTGEIWFGLNDKEQSKNSGFFSVDVIVE